MKEKGCVYNMRRINQLCMNICRCKYEASFLYDYDFISNYLHCYKMKNHSVVSHFDYPQIRFIFILYWTCAFILNKHPDNFVFELSCRLTHFIDVVPELIYNLLQ